MLFYIDTEYTNGNFYLGEIFEIAVLSESSGYVFHSYINIFPNRISKYVMKMCNITYDHLTAPPSFTQVIDGLIKFIKQEATPSDKIIIVGHGSYTTDFPLLITNCMKAKYDYTQFEAFTFIDSMQTLKDKGYQRPNLNALTEGKEEDRVHTALGDAMLLQNVVARLFNEEDISTTNKHSYKLQDILQYLNLKLPISIQSLAELSSSTPSLQSFEEQLYKQANEKTALNTKQISNIAYKYSRHI